VAVTRRTLRISNQLRIVLDQHVDWAVIALVQAWARAWEQVAPEWEAAIAELVAMTSTGKWPNRIQIARAQQARLALEAVTRAVTELADFTGVTVVATTREVAGEVALWQARLIASQLPDAAGTTAQLLARFNRVDPYAIGAIVERTVEQIESWKRPLAADSTEAMRAALVRGVALGENPKVAARRMMRIGQKRFNGGLTRALTLARTEIVDAQRSAAAAHHIEHTDVLTGWTWMSKLDDRTCISCWSRHGTTYDLGTPGPHDHQQGRCARLPITRPWAEIGFPNVVEPPSLLVDAQAKFDALPRAKQLAIMGPVRLKAYETGAITWTALSVNRQNDGWRDSWVPAPVGDVRRRLLTPVA
jgi:hypothetical protein